MLIIIDEDDTYRAWLAAHPLGFVVNAHRKPDAKYLVLHRASCPDINSPRETRWTSGDYSKLCAARIDELERWAAGQLAATLHCCERCHPTRRHRRGLTKAAQSKAPEPHLTKLGGHVLDYLLELAVMSLDGVERYADRAPTVYEVAAYLEKTPAQLIPALRRLREDGFLSLDDDASPDSEPDEDAVLYPTGKALHTVPAFASMTDAELNAALASLRVD